MRTVGSRVTGADGLRAIACLLVVWHHTAQKFNPEGASGLIKAMHYLGMRGEVGVSLFFVLSGCLLSLPFWGAFLGNQEFPSIKKYCLNRTARIAPVFWINLMFCSVVGVLAFNLDFSWSKFLAAFFFVNSYHYSTFFPSELNGPLWSIGLEVSCYVLLPIVLYSIVRVARSFLSALTALFAWITSLQILNPFLIDIFMTDNSRKGWEYGQSGGAKQWLPYWNIASFFTQFLIGSVAALLIVWLKSKEIRGRPLFDVCSLILIGAAIALVALRLNPGSPDPLSQQPYVAPFYAALMASALVFLSKSIYLSMALDNRLFAWLAKLSFSIYLWHVVVMEIIARKFLSTYVYYGLDNELQWILLSGFVLFISTAIAAASWRWVESPILKAVRKLSI